MSIIFSQPEGFDIVSAQSSVVGEEESVATPTHEYTILYMGDGDLYPEAQGPE